MGAPPGNQYALNNDGGRPTTYDSSIIGKVDEYLDWCEKNPLKIDEGGGKKRTSPRLPSYAGFSIWLKIPRRTIEHWGKEIKEFSAAYEKIGQVQESLLTELGRANEGNSRFASFLLSAKHDYREKSDLTSDGKALPTPILGGLSRE